MRVSVRLNSVCNGETGGSVAMWANEKEDKSQKEDANQRIEIVRDDPPNKEVTQESLVEDINGSAYVGFFLSAVMLGVVVFFKDDASEFVDFLDPLLLVAVSVWLLRTKSLAASIALFLLYVVGRFGWLLPALFQANEAQLLEIAKGSIGAAFMSLVFLWFLGKGVLAALRLRRMLDGGDSTFQDS
jgi:hypothetical protein